MKCPRCQADNPETARFCAACGSGFGTPPENVNLETRTLPAPVQSPLIGTLFAGKFRVLKELGRGGMGEVFLAEDIALARTVALKLLPEERYRDPESRERLVREARAAAALDHPYVCSVHEVGEAEGRLFFVMEYVEGRTLRDRIAQGPIPVRPALDIAVEAAEALQSAHEKGLVHRDIKPANIMLLEKGHAKVMDFGLAKPLAGAGKTKAPAEGLTSLTHDGFSPGTPAYMSPEQLRGEELDQRSDIFSFGLVLYEMLTGRHPFKGETGFTTASAILKESPRPLADFAARMPEPLQQVLDKMLAKDVRDRYPSVQAVLEDLRGVQSGLPAEGKILRLLKPARVAVTAGVLVVAVLAAAWLAKTIFFRSAAEALAFEERDWILITDVENLTGDQVFDGTLETALTVGIQQSQYVNVFPRTRVQETLKRMLREDVKKVDEAVGREVALREDIKGLLVCQISKIGEKYLLTSRVIDPTTQADVFSSAARAEGKDEVLSALDDLARKVRRELGESLARISGRRLSLMRATTSSLAALKLYTDAKVGSQKAPLPLLQQALAMDPEFALAHAEIGVRWSQSGNRVKAEEHFEKALGLLDRLTTREQLWIRALVEDWRGNREQGIENYKAYLEQYPDDSGAWFRLGYAYMITDHDDLSIAAFNKVIAIDGFSAASYVNIATISGAQGKDEEALASYRKAFEISPNMETALFVNGEYGFLLVRMGKVQEAARTFEKMMAENDLAKKARGYRSSAYLEMYQGRYTEAAESLKVAILTNKTAKSGLSEMRDHLILATVFSRKKNTEGFRKEMDAVKKIRQELKVEPFFLYLIGKVEARSGRETEA
ncbi:MAG: protein kinase, partial [Candidatus Aminicenantes bacterium]|nr:protein kinase [Candidatus Aminicenantes bacterium]